MKKCRSYAKYKGIHPPKCNGGDPCDACLNKYHEEENKRARQRETLRDRFIYERQPHITNFGKFRIRCIGEKMWVIEVRRFTRWLALGHYKYNDDDTSRQLILLSFDSSTYASEYMQKWFGEHGMRKRRLIW